MGLFDEYDGFIDKQGYEKNREFHRKKLRLVEEAQRNEELLSSFPKFRRMLEEVVWLCDNMRPSVDEIKERVDSNRANNETMEEWKRSMEAGYRIDVELARREIEELKRKSGSLESYIIEEALPSVIERAIEHKSLKDVPFVYYGLNTRRLIYTPATLDFLDVEKAPESLSLRELMSYVKKTNRKREDVRKVFLSSLREQKPLKYLLAETTQGKEIYLSATPYQFSKSDDRVVGIGISFDEKKVTDYVVGSRINRMHKAIKSCISDVNKKIS